MMRLNLKYSPKQIVLLAGLLLALSACVPQNTALPVQAVYVDKTIVIEPSSSESYQQAAERMLGQALISQEQAIAIAQQALFTRDTPRRVWISYVKDADSGVVYLVWKVVIGEREARVNAGTGYPLTGRSELSAE